MATYKQYTLKNGSKLWKVSGYLGINKKTGKPRNTTISGLPTKSAAKDAFESAKYEYKRSLDITPDERLTVAEIFDLWWPMYEPSVETSTALKTERLFKRHIIPYFGKMIIGEVEIMDAERFANILAGKMASYGKVVSYASMLFKFAARMGYINRNPFDLIERPRRHKIPHPQVEQNYYSLDELKQFINAINRMVDNDESPAGKWSLGRALLFLAVTTGLRRGELIALRWSDIDFKQHTLAVKRAIKRDVSGEFVGSTKNANAVRTVYLDPLAEQALKHWQVTHAKWMAGRNKPAITPNGYIFVGYYHTDTLISTNTPRRYMVELCEKTGLRRITIHGLRHTKATLMSEAGITPADIAKILGHSSGEFTMKHYIHATESGIQKAENIYSRLLEKPS